MECLMHFLKRIIKKIKLIFCVVVMILSFSAKATIQKGWVGNFLIGVEGGYGDLYGEVNSSLTYKGRGFSEEVFQRIFSRDFANGGFIYGVLVGYQEISNEWLVGVEINFDLQAVEKEFTFSFPDAAHLVEWSQTMRYQRRNMIGISGRLGYALTNYFMPYARLGGEFSRDKFIASLSGDDLLFPYDLVIVERHWLHRFLLGIGAEFPLEQTCGATIRIEYNLHSKARTIQGSATYIDPIFQPTFASGVQPKMQSVKLSFIWNFF